MVGRVASRRARSYSAGDTYVGVVKLADEGIPFALGHDAELEHYVPAGEPLAA